MSRPAGYGNKDTARDFLNVWCGKSPEKQRHEIPQGKLGPVQIQSGILVNHKHIQKIIKHFIYQIGNNQLLN